MWPRKKPAAPSSDSPTPLSEEECTVIERLCEVAADWARDVMAEKVGRA